MFPWVTLATKGTPMLRKKLAVAAAVVALSGGTAAAGAAYASAEVVVLHPLAVPTCAVYDIHGNCVYYHA
jgi:hypothetical protein